MKKPASDNPIHTDVFRLGTLELRQGSGAWKVGTDSVLLGCWMQVDAVRNALDIGAGSGILSMILTMRNPDVMTDAVEIDEEAVHEAQCNIDHNGLSDRIRLLHTDIFQYANEDRRFDLIMCNPPYFSEGMAAVPGVRRAARQGRGFTLLDLPSVVCEWLTASGHLAVVMPAQMAYRFIEEANRRGLYVQRRMQVRHTPDADDALTFLELGNRIRNCTTHQLTLYSGDTATQEYKTLCGAFLSI